METLKIRKQKKDTAAIKSLSVYVHTHEKLEAISAESGISIIKLITIFTDFAIKHMEIIESEPGD